MVRGPTIKGSTEITVEVEIHRSECLAWRIIPGHVSCWYPLFISHEKTIWKGNNPILRGLINHGYYITTL